MNYHTKEFGPNEEVFKQAFVHCLKIAKKKQLNQIAFAVHTKKQLDTRIIECVMGEKTIRSLKKGVANILDVWIYLITERITPTKFVKGPIFAPHISNEFLEKIISRPDATDIIYIPWSKERLEDYLKKYNSTEI